MPDHCLDDIARKAGALMAALGRELLGRSLQDLGWTFRYDTARRRLGLCRWKERGRSLKVISLSDPISRREGWVIMEDVLRHEVAHAIDYETRGRSAHDAVWKAWARRCGAEPTRAYEGELVDDPASPYLGRCLAPGCSYTRPFYRSVTSAYLCAHCRENGTSSLLRIEERRSGRTLLDPENGVLPPRRPPRYVARCPGCGGTHPFARRPTRRYACVPCCRKHAGGRFDERFELVLHQSR